MPYFETCAMLITFVLLGKILEERAKGATNQAIEALMNLMPPVARVVRGGAEEEVPLASVMVGGHRGGAPRRESAGRRRGGGGPFGGGRARCSPESRCRY